MVNINNFWWKKNRSHPMLGRKHSDEAKKAIGDKNSVLLLGHKVTTTTRKKISNTCKTVVKRGIYSPLYTGTKSLTRQLRGRTEYKQWTRQMMVKKGFTCECCHQVGGKLNLHHILALSVIVKDSKIDCVDRLLLYSAIWDEKNIQLLCVGCHRLTDNYQTKAKKMIL